ncbi:crotonase/enoyl-CoA hydratase family protein [Vitreimonas flagellata]|uniref:crotonase/enoyl-CoA hydratase family protein n=1 Tax=Vitreimonas flagellata TaxID=2560861 RepID=UPI0010757F91|nr:crotonase/enoyl-CoA hydratase family protein [Vitreimonas flagellata]
MTFATFEKKGRVAVVTLNRPESRNAIATQQDCDDLAGALRRANDDREINAVVLTGAGKSFCAGGDLKAIRERTGIGPREEPDDTRANYRRGVHSVIRALADVEVATIAAINGHAIGLGLDIGILCDIRIAGASAKMASSFVKVGIIPGDGGAWILTNAIGASRAAELVLTGDTIDAEEAVRFGLVSRVVADDQLLDEALKLAERVAVNPPRSVRLAKRLLREAQHGRLSDVLELSAAFQALAHETADHKEAVDAFTEKRTPKFTGA